VVITVFSVKLPSKWKYKIWRDLLQISVCRTHKTRVLGPMETNLCLASAVRGLIRFYFRNCFTGGCDILNRLNFYLLWLVIRGSASAHGSRFILSKNNVQLCLTVLMYWWKIWVFKFLKAEAVILIGTIAGHIFWFPVSLSEKSCNCFYFNSSSRYWDVTWLQLNVCELLAKDQLLRLGCSVTRIKIPCILESNPHTFYSFRGLKNQMRFRIACGLDSRSLAGFWKNDRAAVRAVRTIQYNNLLFYFL